MRILVVDDSAVARGAIRRDLKGSGYEILEATTGEEALRRLAMDWPALIVLDVHMPGMDGFETCRRIRALEELVRPTAAAVPVIFVTADDTEAGRRQGFEAGAVDFLGKPFQAGQLRATVEMRLRSTCTAQAPTVLVVDGSALVRRIVGEVLAQVGLRKHGVADGAQALAVLQAAPEAWRLVVTDYQMARMNGDELCKGIRSDARLSHLPVLVMSGLSDGEHFRRIVCAGATDVIRKPFVKEVFLHRLASVAHGLPLAAEIGPQLESSLAQSSFREVLARFGMEGESRQVLRVLGHAGALRPQQAC